MDRTEVPDSDYPSKNCAKAEKALLDTLNKTRELATSQPRDWLPYVYSCMLFPMPPDVHVPPSALAFFEAATSEYLCARFNDINEETLKPKMAHYAKAGHVLALHTPLMMKDLCDGVFGDSFFSKQNVSTERDAKKTRTDVQSMACNAYASFDSKFGRSIGVLRPLTFTIKESVPLKAADSQERTSAYPLHKENLVFKVCIYDATAPDVTSGLWFPITATHVSKSESPGFAILQFSAEQTEITVEGNQSACTHMHLHALVPQNSKSPTFTWSMPLPNASISQVNLEGYVQGNLPSGKSTRALRCLVCVQNTILTVTHPSSLNPDAVKSFGANVCSYYLQFISMIMSYSGKSPSSNRAASDHKCAPYPARVSAVLGRDADGHCGYASKSGILIARQLRARFCLPVKMASILELAARVSKFSSHRDTVVDLLVAVTSLRSQSETGDSSSGSKIIDDLRSNACVIARELCLDTVSNSATELVMNDELSPHLLDNLIISTAVLLSLDPSDIETVVNAAVAQGVKRVCAFLSEQTRSDAQRSVLSDAMKAGQHDSADSRTPVVDMLTKQARVSILACVSICKIIQELLLKQSLYNSMLDDFTDTAVFGPWYSSIALDDRAMQSIRHAHAIVKQARLPFKLAANLVELLLKRVRKMVPLSFDDCTSELWLFVSVFFTLRDDLLKHFVGFKPLFDGICDVFSDITCSASPTSWLTRYAIVQEQKLQEAIVADELHSLVEVSYLGSRVYIWLTDVIATIELMPKMPQSESIPSDFRAFLVLSLERFWEVVMVFVSNSLMEIVKICISEIRASSSEELSLHALGLTENLVRGIGAGINKVIDFADFTADGKPRKGVIATIKHAAFDTARAVRQGKGVISAAAEITKGTVKTAFSVVSTTANVAVKGTALVAHGVDAAASGVVGAVTDAGKAAGLAQESDSVKLPTFAELGGSVFFTISLILSIEEAVRQGISASETVLGHKSLSAESFFQINFQKQYVESLCVEVCSRSSEYFELTFRSIVEGVCSGKDEVNTFWEIGVAKGANAIIVRVPEVSPDPILKLAAQDLYKSYVQVVLDRFCLAVVQCSRKDADAAQESMLSSLRSCGNKLAEKLDSYSKNDFDGCASMLVAAFHARLEYILDMQFVSSKDTLFKQLQEAHVSAGAHASGNQFADLCVVMENRFKGDAKVQSFLQSLKHRKWRSAFDIPEFDVYEAETEARMQDVKDKSKFVQGVLYITNHHICFLEDIQSAAIRGKSHKPSAVDLGRVHVPASTARLRMQWARGDGVSVTIKSRTEVAVNGPLNAGLYQNSCTLTRFRCTNPEVLNNTYLKCVYANQQSKSDRLKTGKSSDSGGVSYSHPSGQEFSFHADLTGGGQQSMLEVSVRKVSGITDQTKGSRRVIASHSLNPNSLTLDEPRDVIIDLTSEKHDGVPGSKKAAGSLSAAIVSFSAVTSIRREALDSLPYSAGVTIRFLSAPGKIKSVRRTLVPSSEHSSANESLVGEENDAEGKEEVRLSCRYLDPKKARKEVKIGNLVITSDEIKFLENTSNDIGMNCAIFEMKSLQRKGSTQLIVCSEMGHQYHFDEFSWFVVTGVYKGNQRDRAVEILEKTFKQKCANKDLQVT